MPTLRLAGSPFVPTCPGANPGRIRSPPWLRCDAGRRRGLCSAEAARRGGDTEEREKGGGGRAAPERKQRGRSDALVGSGELLAIPGVGPRNLRKLVDKGFDDVAQLKQLYRDKVCVELFLCFVSWNTDYVNLLLGPVWILGIEFILTIII